MPVLNNNSSASPNEALIGEQVGILAYVMSYI